MLLKSNQGENTSQILIVRVMAMIRMGNYEMARGLIAKAHSPNGGSNFRVRVKTCYGLLEALAGNLKKLKKYYLSKK